MPLGREIFAWLDGDDRWLGQGLAGTGPISLEFGTPLVLDDAARAFLDVPWELLASAHGFLAADPVRPFCVSRRLGFRHRPCRADARGLRPDLHGCGARGSERLDYEAEEAAILKATNPRYVRLMVEESGCLEFLRERALLEGAFEALHLSCHGDVVNGEAFLALETPEGRLELASAANLVEALGERKPPLVFLSACRTAENVDAATPLTHDLIRAGVPNVLGWDGSVYDSDAAAFAEKFYAGMSRQQNVAYAAGVARQTLLRAQMNDPERGRHWHLARVYAGPDGGGRICDKGKPTRLAAANLGYTEFLDRANQKVPVATRAEFVGRRRQIQEILRAFSEGRDYGVLVHGMGRRGKSSLAARIANRMMQHRTVVIFKDYGALTIFDALTRALPAADRPSFEETWRRRVDGDATRLYDALQAMLEGPLARAGATPTSQPVLLVIDDFEQVLEDLAPGEDYSRVKVAHVPAIAATLAAFRDSKDATQSKLLLTSRYTFALNDRQGRDLTARLCQIPLPPMNAREREKQVQAAVRNADFGGSEVADEGKRLSDLTERAKAAGQGNPGLQSILTRPMLAGDLDAAQAAIEAVESFLATGDIPQDTQAAEFFSRVSLEAFKAALTEPEKLQMRAALLFELPVPKSFWRSRGAPWASPIRTVRSRVCSDLVCSTPMRKPTSGLRRKSTASPVRCSTRCRTTSASNWRRRSSRRYSRLGPARMAICR